MKKSEAKQTDRATKSVRFSVKDAEKGLVTATFSTFNVKDSDGDVTLPGAFIDGQKVLISAFGHASWGGALPVGRGEIHADQEKAWLDGQFFLNTIAGKETFETLKGTDELQEWSYGYDVLERGDITQEMQTQGIWRVLKALNVFEVSPVLVGAGVGTGTISLKSAAEQLDLMPTDAEQKAAETPVITAVSPDAMREFARFAKTRARLAIGIRAA